MTQRLLTAEFLREIIAYDPITGIFTWLTRTPDSFIAGKQSAQHRCAIWNNRYAGKTAGCIDTYGYIKIAINNGRYLAHRLAWIYMTGEQPPKFIDHRNTIESDNRWTNLRAATFTENKRNCGIRKNNTSGFKGVTFDKSKRKWAASITVDRKCHFLGQFTAPELAYAAYCEASKLYHGEFGRT